MCVSRSMISAKTGEVLFSTGLCFGPQELLTSEHIREARKHLLLPVPGWSHHVLGRHPSEHGEFEVEAVTDRQSRIQIVLLAHAHSFYHEGTPDDSERRVYHEAVMVADLHGESEFSWGRVFCQLDDRTNRDWLVVAYSSDSHVPLASPELIRHLREQEPMPEED